MREDIAVLSATFQSTAVGVMISIVIISIAIPAGSSGGLPGVDRSRDDCDEEKNGSESDLHGWAGCSCENKRKFR